MAKEKSSSKIKEKQDKKSAEKAGKVAKVEESQTEILSELFANSVSIRKQLSV